MTRKSILIVIFFIISVWLGYSTSWRLDFKYSNKLSSNTTGSYSSDVNNGQLLNNGSSSTSGSNRSTVEYRRPDYELFLLDDLFYKLKYEQKLTVVLGEGSLYKKYDGKILIHPVLFASDDRYFMTMIVEILKKNDDDYELSEREIIQIASDDFNELLTKTSTETMTRIIGYLKSR